MTGELVMQPLIRYASRSIFDCIAISQAPRSFRQLSTRAFQGSISTQHRILPQRRHFADEKKPEAPTINLAPPSSLPQPPSTASSSPAEAKAPEAKHEADNDAFQNPHDLPSAAEHRRSAFAKRLSHLMEDVQGNIFVASQRLNDLTGYSGIEALKARITVLEDALEQAQNDVRSSRQHYKQTITERAASQREVNNLLSRKESWTPVDVERFTTLYRSDHSNELDVQEASTKLADAERSAEQAASKLSASILSRYHEEQIWSDKIRRMSTWGTWGLMGVNVLLFLVFQFGFEPWRRARLVKGFEEKVAEALENEKLRNQAGDVSRGLVITESKEEPLLDAVVAAGIEELDTDTVAQDKQDPVVDALAACMDGDADGTEDPSTPPIAEAEPQPAADWTDVETWKQGLETLKREIWDLFSDRAISLTQQDVTIIALEGAATGAGIVVMLFMLLSNH